MKLNQKREIEMTLKQDLNSLQREFKALGKKVEKLTKTVEKAEKTQGCTENEKVVSQARLPRDGWPPRRPTCGC